MTCTDGNEVRDRFGDVHVTGLCSHEIPTARSHSKECCSLIGEIE